MIHASAFTICPPNRGKAYETTEARLNEIRSKIREVNPKWNPPTFADRIDKFIGDKGGKVSETDIVAAFKDVVGNQWLVKNILKKSVEDLRLTVKEQRYSLV